METRYRVSLFREHKIIEHTNTAEMYTYLENNDVVSEIVNPYRKENLFIEVSWEITISFSDWHAHYALYDPAYSEMKNDALSSSTAHTAYYAFLGPICVWAVTL